MDPNDPEEPVPILGEFDPPADFSREMAAYEKQRARLVRDHLGKIALVHKDEVVGAFPTAGEAMLEGYRRFGYVKMMLKEIRDPDEPDWVSCVDLNHPCIKWMPRNSPEQHGEIHRNGP